VGDIGGGFIFADAMRQQGKCTKNRATHGQPKQTLLVSVDQRRKKKECCKPGNWITLLVHTPTFHTSSHFFPLNQIHMHTIIVSAWLYPNYVKSNCSLSGHRKIQCKK